MQIPRRATIGKEFTRYKNSKQEQLFIYLYWKQEGINYKACIGRAPRNHEEIPFKRRTRKRDLVEVSPTKFIRAWASSCETARLYFEKVTNDRRSFNWAVRMASEHVAKAACTEALWAAFTVHRFDYDFLRHNCCTLARTYEQTDVWKAQLSRRRTHYRIHGPPQPRPDVARIFQMFRPQMSKSAPAALFDTCTPTW
jgi:hypothetical protein